MAIRGYGHASGASGMFGDLFRQLRGLGMKVSRLGQSPSAGHISGTLRNLYGIGARMPSEMFTRISIPMMKGMQWSTYQPQIQQQQQSMLKGLLESYGGQSASQASGGFAGSAQEQAYGCGVRDVYGKGMTGTIADVAKQRGAAFSNVQDLVGNWQQQAQQFKAGV